MMCDGEGEIIGNDKDALRDHGQLSSGGMCTGNVMKVDLVIGGKSTHCYYSFTQVIVSR